VKIRISFIYEPILESYEHIEASGPLTAEMIAASDQAAYDEGEFSIEDFIPIGATVTFEAVEE
jgi:hypothetical protein